VCSARIDLREFEEFQRSFRALRIKTKERPSNQRKTSLGEWQGTRLLVVIPHGTVIGHNFENPLVNRSCFAFDARLGRWRVRLLRSLGRLRLGFRLLLGSGWPRRLRLGPRFILGLRLRLAS